MQSSLCNCCSQGFSRRGPGVEAHIQMYFPFDEKNVELFLLNLYFLFNHLQLAADNNSKFCCFFKNNKQGMIFHEKCLLADNSNVFHENCLLADNSHEISYLIFSKIKNMSAAVVIGALRV